jgi:hypothetical protein
METLVVLFFSLAALLFQCQSLVGRCVFSSYSVPFYFKRPSLDQSMRSKCGYYLIDCLWKRAYGEI